VRVPLSYFVVTDRCHQQRPSELGNAASGGGAPDCMLHVLERVRVARRASRRRNPGSGGESLPPHERGRTV
jgi:hypothetical protein